MPVRLSKIVKEVNVGVSTLVDYLRKEGIEVENDPNVKVSDEAYALLWKKFGKGEMPTKKKEMPKQEAPVEEPKKEEAKPEPAPEPERPHFKPLGKIDLDAINHPKKAEPVKEEVKEPVVEVSEVKVEAEPVVETPAPVKEEAPAPAPAPVKEEVKAPVTPKRRFR